MLRIVEANTVCLLVYIRDAALLRDVSIRGVVSSPSRGVIECLFSQPITLRSGDRSDAYCSVALLAKLYQLVGMFS